MAQGKFVAYYRVSTAKQGKSGLGLDAQRKAVTDYLNGGAWELVGEFVEVESGKQNDRPQLEQALSLCELTGATLVVAKFDRLSRNAAFLMTLRDSGASFIAADMPDANNLTVGIMALVAQQEREEISKRTKAALAAAKARGVKLGGNPRNLGNGRKGAEVSARVRAQASIERSSKVMKHIEALRAQGATSLRQIATGLNQRGITTPRGGAWSAVQVQRVLGAFRA